MIEIEHLRAEDFMSRDRLTYIDVFGLHDYYDSLAFNASVFLVGPKGVGKSLSVAAYAAKLGVPLITFDCSEDVRRSHLIGKFILRGGGDGVSSPFILGPLTTAFEIANEVGRCILTLEEVNGLTPQMMKVLNPLCDFRRRIEVPEAKKVFRLRDGAELWLTATMNTAGYGGVYALNEDLKSRVRLFPLTYPKPEKEALILQAVVAKELQKTGAPFLQKLLTLAHETRQQAFEYALSTRDLVQIVQDVAKLGLTKGLWISTGKFETDDRETYVARVASIFGIRLGW